MARSNSNVEDFSTVAEVQAALFKQLNPAITTEIYTTNGSATLVASGITESDIPSLKFLTINPVILPARLTLDKAVVTIKYNNNPLLAQNNQLLPQEVTGLVQPLTSAIVRGNTLAVVSGSTTYLPFQNGLGPSNLSYSTVVNNATSATYGLVSTAGYTGTSAFSLTYSNNSSTTGGLGKHYK
jgi:hypothetical protein